MANVFRQCAQGCGKIGVERRQQLVALPLFVQKLHDLEVCGRVRRDRDRGFVTAKVADQLLTQTVLVTKPFAYGEHALEQPANDGRPLGVPNEPARRVRAHALLAEGRNGESRLYADLRQRRRNPLLAAIDAGLPQFSIFEQQLKAVALKLRDRRRNVEIVRHVALTEGVSGRIIFCVIRKHKSCARQPATGCAVFRGNLEGTLRIDSSQYLRLRFETALRGLVTDLERRAVLRPRAAVIVDARGGDVGVAKPFLHLGDVGLVIERIGGGRRAQRMRADLEPELRRVGPHQPVNAVRRDRPFKPARAVVSDRPEQRAVLVEAVPGGVEIVVNQSVCARMQRQIARLAALAGDFQMRHAFARVPEILDLQLAQLLAAQRMEQQRGEDGAVALALDRVVRRRLEELAGLVIAERRRLALAALRLRPLDALDRIMGDGVLVAEIFEQRRQRGEAMPDGAAAKPALRELRRATR